MINRGGKGIYEPGQIIAEEKNNEKTGSKKGEEKGRMRGREGKQ